MPINRIIFAFAGTVILVSLALSQWHSPLWLWLTAFVGANLLQASVTDLCPLAMALDRFSARLGIRPQ